MAKVICSYCSESIYWFKDFMDRWVPVDEKPKLYDIVEHTHKAYVVTKKGILYNAKDQANRPVYVLVRHVHEEVDIDRMKLQLAENALDFETLF